MVGLFGLLMVVWSLVLAPTFCWTGLLTDCCAAPAERAQADDCCGECGTPESSDNSEHSTPLERECGSCANVCGAVTKTTDDSLAGAASAPGIHAPVALASVDDPGGSAGHETQTADRPGVHHIPYPPSDVPLRI